VGQRSPKMDINQLKQILELVREHELAEFEYEHNGLRVRVRKDGGAAPVIVSGPAPTLPAIAPAPAAGAAGTLPAPPRAAEEVPPADEVDLAVVKSPIVGTFYRSPEPGAASFVDIGSAVKKGQVLCIIEAMKLMNEIDSEYDGEIANIYVENGQPVQYGERLFAIRTR
jgi:acetyl-CoA carboxylase biotin carboxyl carrier protein